MNAKRIGILLVTLLFTLASFGCAQQTAQEVEPVEIAVTPEPVTATPEPTPTPLPPKQPLEGVEMLQAALGELWFELAGMR